MIVLDSSAVIALLLHLPAEQAIEAQLHLRATEQICAPELLDVEVASALRKHVALRVITLARAEEALDDFIAFACKRFPHLPLVSRIWELRHNFSAYDATYVALAEELQATLFTCDTRLAGAPGLKSKVLLFRA